MNLTTRASFFLGRVTLAALVALFCTNLDAGTPSSDSKSIDSVADFSLLDHQGNFRHLFYYAKDPQTRAIVLFVQGNGCPLVRKRVPELKRLRDAYAAKGVVFWMINANLQDQRDEVVKEASEFGIDLPILLDETQLVAKALKITHTAEVIVIEPNSWRIRYRGAIDDSLSFETQEPKVQHAYLKEALDAMLAGEDVKTKTTSAPGCAITFAKTPAKVSYTETVAPMLKANCVQCHTRGGIPV